MKRLLALSLIGSSLIIGSNPAKADWDFWSVDYSGDSSIGNRIYTCVSETGTCTQVSSKVFSTNSWQPQNSYVDENNNLVIYAGDNKLHSYDLSTDTWSDIGSSWTGDYQKVFERPTITSNSDGSVKVGIGSKDIDLTEEGINKSGANLIKKTSNTISIGESLSILENSRKLLIGGNTIFKRNEDGTIQIGTDTDDIDITSQGISVGGRPLITRRADGKIHIGKNSLITTEEEVTLSDGRKVQPLYAEDGDGNKIPINIDGSKLLIDGVEVTAGGNNAQINTNKANIKNLGEGVAGSTALTAALSALPQTSKESKLSCGVGTGAYSSRYAVGFGCASKVNKRVDINAGGSYVFGGSKSYGSGTLDSGVVKAGFVFKLGELNKPTQISMKDKKVMETKIGTLTDKNEKLQNKVSTLMARLERLEKIASRDIKSQDLALIKN